MSKQCWITKGKPEVDGDRFRYCSENVIADFPGWSFDDWASARYLKRYGRLGRFLKRRQMLKGCNYSCYVTAEDVAAYEADFGPLGGLERLVAEAIRDALARGEEVEYFASW